MAIQPGMVYEMRFLVREVDTAQALAPGYPEVLSTPRLVDEIEMAGAAAVAQELKPGQITVGTAFNVHHLAPTPVNMEVRIRAELIAVDGRRLNFRVDAWDEIDKIMEGEHERFIIDVERFNQRVKQKRRERGEQ